MLSDTVSKEKGNSKIFQLFFFLETHFIPHKAFCFFWGICRLKEGVASDTGHVFHLAFFPLLCLGVTNVLMLAQLSGAGCQSYNCQVLLSPLFIPLADHAEGEQRGF